jgi:hypothetical protein
MLTLKNWIEHFINMSIILSLSRGTFVINLMRVLGARVYELGWMDLAAVTYMLL